MKSNFARGMDTGSKGYKIFMAMPVLDLSWGFYRLEQSIRNAKFFQTILAGILLVVGLPFMWLVDIITIAKTGHIAWFLDTADGGTLLFEPSDEVADEINKFHAKQKKRIDKEEARRIRKEEKRKQREEAKALETEEDKK